MSELDMRAHIQQGVYLRFVSKMSTSVGACVLHIEVRVVITRLWLVLPSDLRAWLRLSLTHQHSVVSLQHINGILFVTKASWRLVSMAEDIPITSIINTDNWPRFVFNPATLFQSAFYFPNLSHICYKILCRFEYSDSY